MLSYNNPYAQYIGDYNYLVYLNRLRNAIVSDEFKRITDWAISTYSVLLVRFERNHHSTLTDEGKLLLYNQQLIEYDFKALPYTIDVVQECRALERTLRTPIFVTVMGIAANSDYAPVRRYQAADLVWAVLEPLLDRVENILQHEEENQQQDSGHAEVKNKQEKEAARLKNEQRDDPDACYGSEKNGLENEDTEKAEETDTALMRDCEDGDKEVAKESDNGEDMETDENNGSVRPRDDEDTDNPIIWKGGDESLNKDQKGHGSSESDEDNDTQTDTDTDSGTESEHDANPVGRCTIM